MPAKSTPQAILSSREDGYDVQFEEMKGEQFICRKCSYHALEDDVRLQTISFAIKHLVHSSEISDSDVKDLFFSV